MWNLSNISYKIWKCGSWPFNSKRKTGKTCIKMKNVQGGLGVQNISDLALKEIYGIYKTKNLTKEQIKTYKMTEREIFEKYDDFSENELNKKKQQISLCQKWCHDYCY